MKKALLLRAFGASFAIATLAVSGMYYAKAGSVLSRPSVTGPSLGDPTTNLDSITQALQNNTYQNFFSYTTVTVAASNVTATQMQPGINFLTAAIGTTGTVALPTAKPGSNLEIINNTGQGMNIVPSATPFTPGGVDDVNNSASASAAYVNMSNGKVADCYSAQGGHWWCQSGN